MSSEVLVEDLERGEGSERSEWFLGLVDELLLSLVTTLVVLLGLVSLWLMRLLGLRGSLILLLLELCKNHRLSRLILLRLPRLFGFLVLSALTLVLVGDELVTPVLSHNLML